MASRINHALFREVARGRRCAVGNLQRCANSPQNHPALRRTLHGQPPMRVFAHGEGWLCTGDPDQIQARTRGRFTMAVRVARSRSVAAPFCAQANRVVRGEAFFSSLLHRDLRCTGRIRVTFAARRSATRCRPDFELFGGIGTLTRPLTGLTD